MPAELLEGTGVWVGQDAWHGLGITIPGEGMALDEVLMYSGLAGWDLREAPVYHQAPNGDLITVPRRKLVVRGDNGVVVGDVGNRYEIIQNEDTLAFLNRLADEGFTFQTAGAIRGGTQVFMSIRTPFDIVMPDSKIKQYIVVLSSHDGSAALSVLSSQVRVVCANTFDMVVGEGKRKNSGRLTIKHTRNYAQAMAAAEAIMLAERVKAQTIKETAETLYETTITDAEFMGFLNQLVAVPEDEGRGRTMAQNCQDSVRANYNLDSESEIRGTAWGVYNAITRYSCHSQTNRTTPTATAAENKFARLVVNGDPLASKALKLLLPV